jgi:hypothetical protein
MLASEMMKSQIALHQVLEFAKTFQIVRCTIKEEIWLKNQNMGEKIKKNLD